MKRTLAPKVEKGMRSALEDVRPERSFIVYPGDQRFGVGADTEAIGLADLCEEIRATR